MNDPLVEIIILTLNGKEDTIKCLRSLERTRYSNFRVSVVDQNSTDGTPDLIARDFPSVNLIRLKENRGFCGGNNLVLRESKADYCVLLNNDTEQDPDWLTALVRVAEQDPAVASLQPKVLSMREPEKLEYAGAAGGFMDIYGYPICQGRVFDQLEEDHGQYDESRDIFWSCGVAMFLRMSVLRKVGVLDELMFIYAEELDLCWRLNLAGYRLRYVPQSVIYHLGSGTMARKQFRYRKEYLTHRNHWIILVKNYSVASWWRILPMKLVLEVMAAVYFLPKIPRKSLAILHAFLWVLAHPIVLWKKHVEIERLRRVPDPEMMRRMIRVSVALEYFLFKKKLFPEYIPYIAAWQKEIAPSCQSR